MILKNIASFFTHWTKKKIMLTAATTLVLAGTSVGAYKILGNAGGSGGDLPLPEQITEIDPRPEGTVADYLDGKENLIKNAKVADDELKRAGSFRSVANGVTNAKALFLTIPQSIYAEREVSAKAVYKKSISKSSVVSVGEQRFVYKNNYLYREAQKVNSLTDVTWKDSVNTLDKNSFLKRYGTDASGLTSYVINDETVIDCGYEFDKASGLYTFTYTLDCEKSTYYIKREMMTNAGSDVPPVFGRVKLMITMDELWQVKTLKTDCAYEATSMGMTADCTESMEEVFSDFGAYPSVKDLPGYEIFSPHFVADDDRIDDGGASDGGNAGESNGKAEPTAMDALTGMFAPYLGGKKLNACAYISQGDGDPVKADITAAINLENLSATVVNVQTGNVALTYSGGKLGLFYGDFKASLAVDDDIISLFGKLSGGSFDGVKFDVQSLLGSAEIAVSGEDCKVTLPLDLGKIKITAALEGKITDDGYALSRITADIGEVGVKLEIGDKEVKTEDTSDAPDAKDLLLSLLNEKSAFEAETGGKKINLTVDPVDKAINATFGDYVATFKGGVVYLKAGENKFKIDSAPLIAVIKEELNKSGALPKLSLTDIIGVLGKIQASTANGKVSVNADFNGVSLAAVFADENGKLKLVDVNADIKGALKINKTDAVTDVPADLDDYAQSSLNECAEDLLRAAINTLRGEIGFRLSAKVKGVTLNGFVKANLSEKTAALSVPKLFGAELNVEIEKTAAYVSYGKINLKVTFDGAKSLAQKLQTVLSKIVPSLGSAFGGVDIKSVINGVLSGATCEKTQNGYIVSFGFDVGEKRANITVKTADNAICGVSVEVGDTAIELNSDKTSAVTAPNKENACDPAAFIGKIADMADKFYSAKAYEISLSGAQITYGDTIAELNGNILIGRKDGGADIKAAVRAKVNGANLINAEIIAANDKIYCNINGYSFAFAVGKEQDLSGFENIALVQKILSFIDQLRKTDYASINYGEIIKSFNCDENGLSISADLSAFKLGSGVNAEIGVTENGVELKIKGVTAGELSVSADLTAKTADSADIAIPEDYTTKLTVKLDEESNLYAELDFINQTYKFELENLPEGGVKKSLFAEYTNGKLRVKCGDVYAGCDVDEMKKIIAELKNLAHPEGQSSDAQSGDLSGIINDILSSVELNGGEISASVPNIIGLLDLGVTITVKSDYATSANVSVSRLEKAMTVTVGGDRAFCTYDDGNAVDIAAVFNDYFGALKNLVSVGENGVKGWTFSVGESAFTVNGTTYKIGAFTAGLEISPEKVRFYTDGISVNGKKPFTIDVLYTVGKDGEDGKLYVTYNDTTVEKSELRLSVSQTALKGFINTLPQLLQTVPQIADAIAGKFKLGDIVNLATLLKAAEYRSGGKLVLEINGGAIISGLGDLRFEFGVEENGKVSATIGGGQAGISVSAAVAVNGGVTEVGNLKEYDTAKTHINLDSFQTLLKSFVKTAKRTSFHISGNVPVKLNVIGINLTVNVRMDVQVAVEKVDGKNVVYIAAEMERTWGSVEGIAFRDNSGSRGYIYYNGSTDTITTRRDSKGSKWCSKCNKFDCTNGWHTGWHKTEDKYDSERNKSIKYSYDVTESTLSFTDNFTERLLSLVNFTSAINDEIKKTINSGDKKAYGIDDLIGGYEYSDENKSFGVCIRLGAIDDVMGDANIKIYHGDNGELVSVGGTVTLLKVTGVTCNGEISDLTLKALTAEEMQSLKDKVKANVK